ncbi:MAG: hypothetical protein JWM11_3449, partial [Planctomycetaceae bacterium]|nr:hypothetical protein [Planctomycetaceae bacterium]
LDALSERDWDLVLVFAEALLAWIA